MAHFFNQFSEFFDFPTSKFALTISKPRMKITIIVSPELYNAAEPKFRVIFFTRLLDWTLFAKHNKKMCTHNKKVCDWLFSLFLWGLWKNSSLIPENFQSEKKIFSLSSTKSGNTQTQNGNEIVFEYFSGKNTNEEIVASRSFQSVVAFYLPLI